MNLMVLYSFVRTFSKRPLTEYAIIGGSWLALLGMSGAVTYLNERVNALAEDITHYSARHNFLD